MLSKAEITGIRALLTSDRINYKGSEIGVVASLLTALAREENAARIQPRTPLPDPPTGSETTTED